MIYVSLTTVPDRMQSEDNFKRVLVSLLNQDTHEPYKVILNIPTKYLNYDIADVPIWLSRFEKEHSDKLTILQSDVDYGPITNLLYPLKYFEMDLEDIIIVCDDDHEYESNMVSYHLKKLEEYPDHHAICFRGNQPMDLRVWDSNGKKMARLYQTHVYFPTKHDIYLRFPDHWHTVSYRRKFFSDDIFDEEFLSMTWNNDQLMGYYAAAHNFYFLCATYDLETDFRPVNDDGRGANSFPIKTMLPVDGDSGCNKYRERLKDFDVWQNEKFVNGCREKPAMEYLQMFPSRATVRVQSAKAASTTIQDSESVVVTLTTIPTRLIDQPDHNSGIRPGLKTILEQVDVKYEVHLNIPYAYKYKRILLPDWMEEWTQKYPHLKIFRCPDFGPITKLYPTLQRVSDPSTILITVDDDLIYTNDFVKAHLEERKQYPDCALGFAGITSIEDDGTCGRYHFASTQPHDTRVRLLEGYKTVSYKREFFDSEFDEFAFTHWNDDVSISAYLGYKNIKKIVLKTRNTNDFTQRVESFPVIAHSPVAGGVIGCNIFRLDDGLRTHSDVVSDEWYKLGYLER